MRHGTVLHSGFSHLPPILLSQVIPRRVSRRRITVLDLRLPLHILVTGLALPLEQGFRGLLVVVLRRLFHVLRGQVTHPRVGVVCRQFLYVSAFPVPDEPVEQVETVHPVFRRRITVAFGLVRVLSKREHPLCELAAVLPVRDFLPRVQVLFCVLRDEDNSINFVLIAVRHHQHLCLEARTRGPQILNIYCNMPDCSP